jgi:DNA-dependent RNA polymerase auxiliary subunit epsilon
MKYMLFLDIIEKVTIGIRRDFFMIFKVYFQEDKLQVPVREKTKTVYVKADSEREVRTKLADRPYNIEFVTPVTGAFLEYEQLNEDFKVLEID